MLEPGPRLIKKGFTGPQSHKGWETLPEIKFVHNVWDAEDQ